MSETKVLVSGFKRIGDDENSSLKWFCPPDGWDAKPNGREGKDGWWKVDERGRLIAAAPAKKDFWRKTYYDPPLVKDDGSFLFATVSEDELPVTVETSFTLSPRRQFDQAGIMIRLDHEHWLKTGIEVVDGKARLSCVATNAYSDWSTQDWHGPGLRIRVHVLPGGNFVVEAAATASGATTDPAVPAEEWSFVRIAHLSRSVKVAGGDALDDQAAVTDAWRGEDAPPGYLWAGVFVCCPEDQGGSFATFHDFSIARGSSFKHDADGNHE